MTDRDELIKLIDSEMRTEKIADAILAAGFSKEENAQLKKDIVRMVATLSNPRKPYSLRIVEAMDIARQGPEDTDD